MARLAAVNDLALGLCFFSRSFFRCLTRFKVMCCVDYATQNSRTFGNEPARGFQRLPLKLGALSCVGLAIRVNLELPIPSIFLDALPLGRAWSSIDQRALRRRPLR